MKKVTIVLLCLQIILLIASITSIYIEVGLVTIGAVIAGLNTGFVIKWYRDEIASK